MKPGFEKIDAQLRKLSKAIIDKRTLIKHLTSLLHVLMSGLMFDSKELDIKAHVASRYAAPLFDIELIKSVYQNIIAYDMTMESDYERSPRGYRQTNHEYYHYELLLGLIYLNLHDVEKAKVAFDKAKAFVTRTASAETDYLAYHANRYLSMITSITHPTPNTFSPPAPLPQALSLTQLETSLESTAERSLLALSQFDRDKKTRFFIDPQLQLPTKLAPIKHWEDREPGSIQAQLNGLEFLTETAAQPINLQWIQTLHQLISQNVKGLNGRQDYGNEMVHPGHFRTTTVLFGLSHFLNLSPNGIDAIRQFIDKTRKHTDTYTFHQSGRDGIHFRVNSDAPFIGGTLIAEALPPSVIAEILEDSLETYREDIKIATASAYPVRAIVQACARVAHEFCLTHPFRDCNLRLSQQLLNKLLVENGLPLTILKEPALLEGHSPEELVDEILDGMYYFKLLATYDYFPGTAPLPEESLNPFIPFLEDDIFLSLKREHRQYLQETKEAFILLLKKGLISTNQLIALTFDELRSINSHMKERNIDSIPEGTLLIDKIMAHQEKETLCRALGTILSLLSNTPISMQSFFEISQKERAVLISRESVFRALFKENVFASYEDFYALSTVQQDFITKKYFDFKKLGDNLRESFSKLLSLPDNIIPVLSKYDFRYAFEILKQIDPMIDIESAASLYLVDKDIDRKEYKITSLLKLFDIPLLTLSALTPDRLSFLLNTTPSSIEQPIKERDTRLSGEKKAWSIEEMSQFIDEVRKPHQTQLSFAKRHRFFNEDDDRSRTEDLTALDNEPVSLSRKSLWL